MTIAPRRWAAVLLLALVASLVAVSGSAPAAHRAGEDRVVAAGARADDRPNVVVVMADDMRVDDLRFMPRLRRLVGSTGATFANSFSSYPLCCPARASFLLGTYAHNHGVYYHEAPYGFRALDDSETVATALSRAGYQTGFVGKYLNGYGPQRSRVSGEKPSVRYVPPGWTDWMGAVENVFPPGHRLRGSTYDYLDTTINVNGVLTPHQGEYQTGVFGRLTRSLVRKYAGGGPFFLYLSAVAPHHGGPREPDDPKDVRRRDGKVEEFRSPARPPWVRGRFDDRVRRAAGLPRGGGPAEADVSDKPRPMRVPELRRAERRALAELTRQRGESLFVLDREVKRLVAELRRTGEWRDTVLLFTSDNGYFLGEHRVRTGKVRPHEPSLKVPLLVTGPGVGQGRRYDPVETVDLTATILDLAGATMRHALDGASVAPSFQADQGWTDPVVYEGLLGVWRGKEPTRAFPDARTAVGIRTAQYKYVRQRSGGEQLYDLNRDPNELHSRHDDPAMTEVLQQLRKLWWQYKDCDAEACLAPLPEAFRATPGQAQRWTMLQAEGRERRTGLRY